jgi:hypothetical protein
MVPSAFVFVDALPLTSNGKLDRNALPREESLQRPDTGTPYVAPSSEVERTLVAIWSDLLGVTQIGVNDDFFEIGGHSLMAIRVLSRVNQLLGARLALRDVFEAPTIHLMAQRLADTVRGEAPQASVTHGDREEVKL